MVGSGSRSCSAPRGLALVASPAVAKPAPVTKITFKLDAHELIAAPR